MVKKIKTSEKSDSEDEIPLSDLKPKQNPELRKQDTDKKYFCVECFEDYSKTSKTVDWICCMRCNNWLHETCTLHLNICNPCKRAELQKKLRHLSLMAINIGHLSARL